VCSSERYYSTLHTAYSSILMVSAPAAGMAWQRVRRVRRTAAYRTSRYSRTAVRARGQQGTQGESEGEGAPRLLPSPAGLLAAPTQRAVGHRVLCAAI
jgi:hypothetical protein